MNLNIFRKKGMTTEKLPVYAAILAVVALVGGLSAIILENFKTSGSYSTAVNTTLDNGVAAVQEISDWLDIIALVVAAVVILGMVFVVLRIVNTQGQV